ncbi:MAG: DUF2474 domain-containing protein [Rhodobacteraceae bacterium]|jgi:preprotein translocase subunit Sss1|nr:MULTISPECIES: hypothetical protein [Salipiger]MAB05469.1 DUF2474 domain-containing protein [Paracoccaceae bacterium]SFD10089.1 hypothetical protein SAMN05444415_107167 [Salipiger profundus]
MASRLKKIGWFIVLYAAGILVVGSIAYLIRLMIL